MVDPLTLKIVANEKSLKTDTLFSMAQVCLCCADGVLAKMSEKVYNDKVGIIYLVCFTCTFSVCNIICHVTLTDLLSIYLES